MKKLLCVWMLLVLIAPAALAKSWVEDTSMRYDYRYTEFAGDVPQDFAQALADWGYDPADVVCGALREPVPLDEQAFASIALLGIRTESGVTLVGGARNGVWPWAFYELGEKMIFQDRPFRVVFPSSNRLCLAFDAADGAEERYALWWGMGDPSMWVVERYEREYADGSGYVIDNMYGSGGFRVAPLNAQPDEGTLYYANWAGWTTWMNSLADFPTTEEAAREKAEASWQAIDGRDIVMLYGNVNLRTEPTTRSHSLGRYRDCALACRLDVQGEWYRVRVGGVEGWVHSNYAREPRTQMWQLTLYHGPLSFGLIPAQNVLRAQPSANADAVANLPAGSMTRVIAETDDGWLHVVLAEDNRCEMNPDAVGGYVRASEVMEGSASWHGLE